MFAHIFLSLSLSVVFTHCDGKCVNIGVITDFLDINHETSHSVAAADSRDENDFRQSLEYYWAKSAGAWINQRIAGHSLNGSKNEMICLETIFMNNLISGAVEKSMKKHVSVTRAQSRENDFERPTKSRSSSSLRAEKMKRSAPDSLSVSKMARQVICEAQKKEMVAVIVFLSSCDTLYPMIQEAIQSQIVIFVIDDRFCIKVPIKTPFLFIDKTFHSDVTQAVRDVVTYNGMKDVVIIYNDDQDDYSVVSWNERIKVEKLIQKLSTNFIRTTLVKISSHLKRLLLSSRTSFSNNNQYTNQNKEDDIIQKQDQEASLNTLIDLMAHKIEAFDNGMVDWRSTGMTLVALTERIVLDSLTNLLIQRGKFPVSTTIFHVDDIWFPPKDLDPNIQHVDSDHQIKKQPSKYWFDQDQILLKRRYHSDLIKIFKDLTINHVPKNKMIGQRESFIICAIHSIADAAHYINERVEQPFLSACESNQGSQSTINSIQTEKINSASGPPEKFAEAVQKHLELMDMTPSRVVYDVLKLFPVNASEEIFLPISEWKGSRWSYKQVVPTSMELLSGRHIKIVAPNYPPYTRYRFKPGEPQRPLLAVGPGSMLIGLVNLLTYYFNATYEIVESKDWGVNSRGDGDIDQTSLPYNDHNYLRETEERRSTKSGYNWTGAIGMLLKREADLIPFLSYEASRAEVVGFTIPIFTESIGILTQSPSAYRDPNIFLRPFTWDTWMCFLISVPITSLILYFLVRTSHKILEKESEGRERDISMETEMRSRLELEVGLRWKEEEERRRRRMSDKVGCDEVGKKENNEQQATFLNCLWFILGTCVAQGGIGVGSCDPGRILVAFWWMIIIILAATYSGNLIGFLAFPESIWRVNSLDDLLTPNAPKAMIITGSWFHQQLMAGQEPQLKGLSKLLSQGKIELISPILDKVTDRIISGEAVLVGPESALSELIKQHVRSQQREHSYSCHLAIAPHKFLARHVAIGFRQGSPFIPAFNTVLKNFRSTGVIQKWKRYILPPSECTKFDRVTPGGTRITLLDMMGVFYVLFFGIASSLPIFFAEKFIFKNKYSLSSVASCCWWLFLPSNPAELQEWAEIAANATAVTPATTTISSYAESEPRMSLTTTSAGTSRPNETRNYLTFG